MDRRPWQGTVRGAAELDMTEWIISGTEQPLCCYTIDSVGEELGFGSAGMTCLFFMLLEVLDLSCDYLKG